MKLKHALNILILLSIISLGACDMDEEETVKAEITKVSILSEKKSEISTVNWGDDFYLSLYVTAPLQSVKITKTNKETEEKIETTEELSEQSEFYKENGYYSIKQAAELDGGVWNVAVGGNVREQKSADILVDDTIIPQKFSIPTGLTGDPYITLETADKDIIEIEEKLFDCVPRFKLLKLGKATLFVTDYMYRRHNKIEIADDFVFTIIAKKNKNNELICVATRTNRFPETYDCVPTD